MTTTRMFLIIIVSMAAIGIDIGMREPIFNFNYSFQTEIKFDIITVCLAYVLGFIMSWLGWSSNDNQENNQ